MSEIAKVDEITIVSSLSIFAQLRVRETSGCTHAYIRELGIKLNYHVTTSFIDMYSTCGDTKKAVKVFYLLERNEVIVWSAMIFSLTIYEQGKVIIDLFFEMQEVMIKLNLVTSINVLRACSHARLVTDDALALFILYKNDVVQAMKPPTLVLLSNGCKQAFFIRDPVQFPTTVTSPLVKKFGYGMSLLKRFQRAGYFVKMLKVQYQMRLEIRSLPSSEFYDETQDKMAKFSFRLQPAKPKHGSLIVAAITSYSNTLIPNVMLGASILAKKNCELSLHIKFWIQTSLAPSSEVVTRYFLQSGLNEYLYKQNIHIVRYERTTNIGNIEESNALVASIVVVKDIKASIVLCENGEFKDYVHVHVHP